MCLLLPTLIVVALLTGCATPTTRTTPQSAPKGWLYSPPSSTAPITRIIPIRRVPPTYPEKAQSRREQGCVNVRFRLDSHGRPTQLRVFSSQPRGIFDQAAIRTMSQWRFRVTDEYGHPIPIRKNFLLGQIIIFQAYGTNGRTRSLLNWICFQPPPRTLIVSPAPTATGARISIKKHGAGIDVVQMPTQSNRALKNGWVDVDFCIDTRGQVSDATIEASSPHGLYDSVALDALKTWQFTVRRNRRPVGTCELHYHIPVIGAASLARSPVVINQRPTAIRTQDLALPEGKATPLDGKVTLQFCIDKDGSVSNARVISSRPGRIFAQAALRTLHVWQYWPRTVNGKPQRTCNVQETVIFRLGHQHLVWVYSSAS